MIRRRLWLWVLVLPLALALVAAGAGLWVFRGSLPRLEGSRTLPGLGAPVTVGRDELGVPEFTGGSWEDLWRALGYVHAQERFFQMDLMRRQAAGRLAELFGPVAVEADQRVRIHRFGQAAREHVAALGARHRRGLAAYTEGVNAGLDDLRAAPFEYWLLRQDPEPWREEDSLLVVYAMYLVLQDEAGRRERALSVMHDALPGPAFRFLATPGTPWDAPLSGEAFPVPPMPGPDVFPLRRWIREAGAEPGAGSGSSAPPAPVDLPAAGSNHWAVAGKRTRHGGALLANDMHLGLSLPNTWFRARLTGPHPLDEGASWSITGVTLPGVPLVVAGSNAHVAWGLTNSYGDWSDLVVVEEDEDRPDHYRVPEGSEPFLVFHETIRDARGGSHPMTYRWTRWGPVLGRDHRGRLLSLRWVAHGPEGMNFAFSDLAFARSAAQAAALANRAALPAVNVMIADREGHIAWTLAGAVPLRRNLDPRLPASWASGDRGWDGWLAPEDYPRILDPPSGFLWTANNRVVDAEALQLIGDGGYALGARARQIRDRLHELDVADEAAMLSIQLDDRAVFLAPWRDLLLEVTTAEVVGADPDRAEFRRLVATRWEGRASVESVGYRLVRAFRSEVVRAVLDAYAWPCRRLDPQFEFRGMPQLEGPVWETVTRRPLHLLHPDYEDWDAFFRAAVDRAVGRLKKWGGDLAARRWGERNRVQLRHPLSMGAPLLSRWLDLPPRELPGDLRMPRVQTPGEGASERFAVSPGREPEAYFHMPGGQSGHPGSPYYARGHEAWEEGVPLPFLPGPPVHRLELLPPSPER